MKVSQVAVAYTRKFNMGDYNSLGLECTLWADLEEGDTSADVIQALQDQAREAVKREYARLPKKTGPASNPAPPSS
jgi:hypothetical protein